MHNVTDLYTLVKQSKKLGQTRRTLQPLLNKHNSWIIRRNSTFIRPHGEEIPSSSQRFALLNDFGCVAWILELCVPLPPVSCCSQLFDSVPLPQ